MRRPRAICLVLVALAGNVPGQAEEGVAPDSEQLSRFAALALECVHRRYPSQISHVLQSDADARPPHALNPIFYGCYDWHSAVHGHWLLARLARLQPRADFASRARAALSESFTEEKVRGEVAYFSGVGRAAFERPYGLAWFLQLTAELRQWNDPQARRWVKRLSPLEGVVAERLLSWLPDLVYPVRSGTHNQTAFAFALALDWARQVEHRTLTALLEEKALAFHADDRDCPLAYEPSGEDFLSPCLMEADLMRRVIPAERYPAWLGGFLPEIPTDGSTSWIRPGVVRDASDGKLVHLDGVNLSRAWNLEGIAASLPDDDPRRDALLAAAREHARAGLAAVTGEHYAGGHWLASFATYLVTGKAQEAPPPG